jgi:deoxyadenosine/deoxycytidine kinase
LCGRSDRRVQKKTLLELFYEDPKTHAFALHVLILTTFRDMILRTLAAHPDCTLLICERSVLSTRYVFTDMLHETGIMTDMEYQVYVKMWESLVGTGPGSEIQSMVPERIIYLDTDPVTCWDRTVRRSMETGDRCRIDLAYLTACRAYYERMLSQTQVKHSVMDVTHQPKELLVKLVAFALDQEHTWSREVKQKT